MTFVASLLALLSGRRLRGSHESQFLNHHRTWRVCR